MRCSVMHSAEGDQVVCVVLAAFGTWFHVMQVQEARIATTRNDATLVIAPQHPSARRRRDRLLRANAHVGAVVGGGAIVREGAVVRHGAKVLTVATGHGNDVCADGHELSASLLMTAAALRADRERNLVARRASVCRVR